MRISRFRATLCALITLFCASAFAQETTLKLGVLGSRLGDPPNTQDLSTAQVDAFLNAVQPTQFGAHYTRDKANALFANLDNMRLQLNSQLSTALGGIQYVSLATVSVNTNSLAASFAQTPSSVRVTLSGLSVFVAARYTKYDIPLLCESVDGHFTINFVIGGDYDIATGTLQNPRLDFGLNDINTSCNGLLGQFGDLIRSAIGYGTSQVGAQLVDIVRSQSNAFLQTANMRLIFSISDFLNGLRNFGGSGILNVLANEAIDRAQQIIANPARLYEAVKLTLSVSYGPSGNIVSFIASHAEETPVSEIQYVVNRGLVILFDIPAGTSQATLYQRGPNTNTWNPITTVPSGTDSYFVRGTLPIGTEIVAIGQNRWHSSLRSEGGLSQIVTEDPTCSDPPCSPIEP